MPAENDARRGEMMSEYDGPNYHRQAQRIIRALRLGCGDNSCYFARLGGMATNGGCQCDDKIEVALCKAWEDGQDDAKALLGSLGVTIGLRAQGHIPTVEGMLAAGCSWTEIGATIGWDAQTAREWYEREAGL